MCTLTLAKLFRHCFVSRVRNIQELRNFQTSSALLNLFYEKDEKGGYKDRRPQPSKIQMIRDGMKELKQEIAMWTEEVKVAFESDPFYIYRAGETDVIWKFGNTEALSNWVVTSDSDHNEGYSTCSLTLNKQGKGMFSGNLSTRVPKDGRIKRAGYCNIRTLRARVSNYFHHRYLQVLNEALFFVPTRNRSNEKHI